MKSTSAAQIIMKPLWPGPGFVVTSLGALLVMYASRSATRPASSTFVGAGAAGAAAGAAGAAAAGAAAGGSSACDGRAVITSSAADKARKNAIRGMVFIMCEVLWFGE